MNQPAQIDLEPDHRSLVLSVLRANLPHGAKVWVFGSRATGRARRYSDLDLVIDAGPRLTHDFAGLTEAFSDSDLPIGSMSSTGTASRIVGSRRSRPNACP